MSDAVRMRKVPDMEPLPLDLAPATVARDVREIIAMEPGDRVHFRYGDFVPNADAFNHYIEANVSPGVKITLERDHCLKLIKEMAMSLNASGLNSLPMLCLGKECSVYDSCPLQRSGMELPIGEPCPVEKTAALSTVRRLQTDFGEGRTAVDQIQLSGVAALELLKGRVYGAMSKDPSPVIEVKKGIDNRGDAIIDKVDNPAYKALSQIHNLQQTLLKSLHLTNEQRKKAEMAEGKPKDKTIEKMKEKLRALKMNKNSQSLGIIDLNPSTEESINHDEDIPLPDAAEPGRSPGTQGAGVPDSEDAGSGTGSSPAMEGASGHPRTTWKEQRGDRAEHSGQPSGGLGESPLPNPNAGNDVSGMAEV